MAITQACYSHSYKTMQDPFGLTTGTGATKTSRSSPEGIAYIGKQRNDFSTFRERRGLEKCRIEVANPQPTSGLRLRQSSAPSHRFGPLSTLFHKIEAGIRSLRCSMAKCVSLDIVENNLLHLQQQLKSRPFSEVSPRSVDALIASINQLPKFERKRTESADLQQTVETLAKIRDMLRYQTGEISLAELKTHNISKRDWSWFAPQATAIAASQANNPGLRSIAIELLSDPQVQHAVPHHHELLTQLFPFRPESSSLNISEQDSTYDEYSLPLTSTTKAEYFTHPKVIDPDQWRWQYFEADEISSPMTYEDEDGQEKQIDVAKTLAPHWQTLATMAGYTPRMIASCEQDNDFNDANCARQILKVWANNGSRTALGTPLWEQLINILRDEFEMHDYTDLELIPALEKMAEKGQIQGFSPKSRTIEFQPIHDPIPQDSSRDYQDRWGPRYVTHSRLAHMVYTNYAGHNVRLSINDELAIEWRKLGEAIGMEGDQLINIEQSCDNNHDRLRRVLKKWTDNGIAMKGGSPTWNRFIEVLSKDLDMGDYVDEKIIPMLNALEERQKS
ncbi:death domain-containing protein [Spongorhabdus nitratireducens]